MKALFIGLDALDKDLMNSWARDGLLPTFARLLNDCAWAPTSNPVGLYVGAVWPSIFTSVSPARHARYCWEQLQPGTYETRLFTPTQIRAPAVWEAFSKAGKRVAVVDVPKAPLATDINGLQIADWGTHDPDYQAGLRTVPPGLEDDVLARFGSDPVGNCNAIAHDAEGIGAFVEQLQERIATKLEITKFVLGKEDWDCLFTVFSESHCVGHQCWHVIDPAHPRYDPKIAKVAGNPMLTIYRAIDSAVAELLALVDEDVPVIILSSHGMGPHYEATYFLDTMLQKLEAQPPVKSYPITTKLLEWGWAKLPLRLRHALRPASNKTKTIVDPRTRSLSSRKYFKIPNNDVFGGIRINLKGREPGGKVSPGDDYEQLCQQLDRDLMSFINVETGECLVDRVVRTDDVYHGPYRDHLPDLMVEWNRKAPVTSVYSPKTGQIDDEYRGVRTGDHKAEGIVFIRAEGIKAGQMTGPVSGVDIGPTLAAWLGVDLQDTDGKSLVDSR
jgi:predicted AlkP superfamily phosphohydrolase/phosphomutase